MRRVLIGVGLCVALAAPATASAVDKTFAGKVKGGGKIGITADVVDGHAVEVKYMRIKKVPAHCVDSGGAKVGIEYFFSNLFVNANNRFAFDGDDGGGGHLRFKGTFKRHAKKVEGSLKSEIHFTSPVVDDCNTGKRGYEARRGPLPKAPSSKQLLRLSP
jgi:hypothetical protein